MVKISILIPVYNVADYIIRCLNSVVEQTYKGPLECILVDDCGSDNSIPLVKKFLESYSGNVMFRILHHDRNRGLAAARNTAVENAEGDFVFHLDSDDWLEPTAIEHLFNLYYQTGADIVSGNALRHTDLGEFLLKEPRYKSPKEMVHNTIEMTLDHVVWRRLIKRSLYIDNQISAVEGIDVGEDHHTLPRLAYYATKVATLDEVVYHYNCMNPNSYMSIKTDKVNLKRFKSDLASIEILQNFFKNKDAYCESRLKKIKTTFGLIMLEQACHLNDVQAYRVISKDIGILLPYSLSVVITKTIDIIRKLKRIVQFFIK